MDADRILALSYVPSARRPAVEALWRLDVALGKALQGGREPLISQIKLAWWRDSLVKLDSERAPGEPVLEAAAERILPKGVTGAQLARMEEGWAVLLSQAPLTAPELDDYAALRGGLLFQYSAVLLDGPPSEVRGGGEAWALVDLARNSNRQDAEAALGAARGRMASMQWPARLRPLGMLALLAARDVESGLDRMEPHGAPRRMARMLRHRLTGR